LNKGINLASRPIRSGGLLQAVGVSVFLLALLATGIHLAWCFKVRSEVTRRRDDVNGMQTRLDLLSQRTRQTQQTLGRAPSLDLIRWLIALERSGATEVVDPTEVLGVTADALPPDSRVVSVWLESSPPEAEMTVEALVGSPRSATDFVSGLSQGRRVVETEILEETHRSDGEILLRIGISVSSRGTN
jgi:hypothetical protein